MNIKIPFAIALAGTLSLPAWGQICKPDHISASTPMERFDLVDDTAHDLHTGLTWQRCAAGQVWNGSGCAGPAATYTWEEALALAGNGWRLPNVKELQSIVEAQCYGPAINVAVFPDAPDTLRTDFSSTQPQNGYWSSTPSWTKTGLDEIGNAIYENAWFVDAYEGYGFTAAKQTKNFVRLVK